MLMSLRPFNLPLKQVLCSPFERPSPYMSNMHKLSRAVFLPVCAYLSVYALIIFKEHGNFLARAIRRLGRQNDTSRSVTGSQVGKSHRKVNPVTDRDGPSQLLF